MSAEFIPAPTVYDPAKRNTIQLIAVPAFSDNYLWMVCKGDHAIVVDPGQAAPIQTILQQHQLTLDAILLTHHHHDHVGGVAELKASTQATVYGPATEQLPACDRPMAEGDKVSLPGVDLALQVLDVPGHTAGHIAYHGTLGAGQQPVLFCGDTLFAAGCGRLFEGSPEQMLASLTKLAALHSDTLVCCAHEYTLANLKWALAVEPDNAALRDRLHVASQLRASSRPTLPSTLQSELDTNPFLRTSQENVVAAAARHAGQSLDQPVAVFASLREWKNNF
ncbi:MAG TPA: hydroxyacylglutathione hydrolase [Burkholderiaceae bacterium]|nr:hydroxyacylglutathione hydrolase [Burkholderiaceae bacterium]